MSLLNKNNKLEYKEPNEIKRWTCIYRIYLPRAYLCRKKVIVKIPRWPVLSSETLTWGGYEGHNLYKFLGWEGLQKVKMRGILGA